jgi:hypothetical protein
MARPSRMTSKLQGDLRTISVSALTVAVMVGAPAAARSVARFARNADKVDGKHAVKSSAPIPKRKGKLVATSTATGRLPNNIIKKAPDAGKLDGIDSSAFALGDELSASGKVNQGINPVDWSKLKNVPGEIADGLDDYGPRAWGHIDGAGFIVESDGVQEVTPITSGTKSYCIQLGFTPEQALVTPELKAAALAAGVQAYATVDETVVDAAGNCVGLDAEAMVTFRSTTTSVQAAFFVSFMDAEPPPPP